MVVNQKVVGSNLDCRASLFSISYTLPSYHLPLPSPGGTWRSDWPQARESAATFQPLGPRPRRVSIRPGHSFFRFILFQRPSNSGRRSADAASTSWVCGILSNPTAYSIHLSRPISSYHTERYCPPHHYYYGFVGSAHLRRVPAFAPAPPYST